jgi:REP element-mobilizing transposase RayT
MSHSYTCLFTHAVFGTKGRLPLIVPEIKPRLIEYIGGIVRAERCSLIAANAMDEHAHLLIHVHPSVAVANLLREIKSHSSSWIRETFPSTEWAGWQGGYGGFSVSRSGVDSVIDYIDRQEEHHQRMTFEQEFIAMLDKHGIDYDPRYLWDDD